MSAEQTFATSETGGTKETKQARFDQMPSGVMWELAEHYGKGNAKYPADEDGIDNWRKGYDWSLSYAAAQRHLNLFWQGEDIDPETGSKHLIAAAWHCLAMAHWMDDPELVEKFDRRQDKPRVNGLSVSDLHARMVAAIEIGDMHLLNDIAPVVRTFTLPPEDVDYPEPEERITELDFNPEELADGLPDWQGAID